MNYKSFGKTDLKVSEIGLGCQSLGGGLYYKDHGESVKMLDQALDYGVNFYDTSDHYSQGASEILLGKAFKGKRDRVIIATKVGTCYSSIGNLALRMRPLFRSMRHILKPFKIYLHQMRASQKHQDFSSAYLTQAVEQSLRRLKSDYIDLFQLHKPNTLILEKGDFCETLERLKAQGKIRYYGISCATVEDALLCLKIKGISSIQIEINLLDQRALPELLPRAQQMNIAVIARNPRAQGHLTSALSDIMAETYARNQKEVHEKVGRSRQFQFLVSQKRTLAQAALRFVLQIEGIAAVIPRAITRKELEENLGTLSAPLLTKEELENIYAMGLYCDAGLECETENRFAKCHTH